VTFHIIPIFGVANGTCACGRPDCPSPGKHPIGRLVPNGLKDATDTATVIDAWAAAAPGCNFAIATGPSGLAVLDVDGPEGEASLARIIEEWGDLPQTMTVATGRGRHLYFANHGDPVPCSTSRVGVGLDVRAEGGYVLATGSRHVSGASYRTLDGRPPERLPGWLRKLMLPAPRSAPVLVQPPPPTRNTLLEADQLKRASAYLAKMQPSVAGEGGHDRAWSAAIHLFGFGLSADQVFHLLALEFNPRCSPPWSEKELRHKVENAREARIGGGFHLEGDKFIPAPPGTTVKVPVFEPSTTARNMFDLSMAYWNMRRENKPPPSAPTGMAELDKRIGGLRAGRLYILTADTKSGKTSMATQWFWSVLQAGVPAMLLSMEMTCEEVAERIAVQRTHLPREGALSAAYAVELKEMIKTFAGMANAAMVDDRGRLTIEEMRERTRAWLEREDVKAWRKGSIAGVLLVDYLQLSGSMKKNATKEQEIAEVSQGLKEVAKEFGIAVVALAQLNRQGTLRHSGQIEQDADCVLRLKEEDNDTALSSPFIVREPPKVRRMALIIERIRNGESGSIAVEFNGPLTSFKEL